MKKSKSSAFILILGLSLFGSVGVSAQSAATQVEQKARSLAPRGWTVPRTPDGQPELQGYYTNVSLTPLERAADVSGKLFFSPQEVASYENTSNAARNKDRRDGDKIADVNRAYNDLFWDGGKRVAVTLQTSLVVDPPDGRIPAYTLDVQKEMAQEAQLLKEECADPTRACQPGQNGKPSLADKPSDFPLMARCISWPTAGPPMLPSAYDSNYHIVQTRDNVMIQIEGGREVRIIPLTTAPHISPDIRLWQGDSRGHWEGDTLVVDTTNFNDETNFRRAGRNLHVVERFTRVAPGVLLYEFTVYDPSTFTRPWTAIIPMTAMKGPIFEYACNEGNYGLADILRGARLEEKRRVDQSSPEGTVTPEQNTNSGSGGH